MNMFARFDVIPAMTLQDIKEAKCHARTHKQNENSITPSPQTKFAGALKNSSVGITVRHSSVSPVMDFSICP